MVSGMITSGGDIMLPYIFQNSFRANIAQSAGAVEYTDCSSVEG